ncbi:MAG: thioredoxin family protein [Kiritimatiellae bacterium]|nr:thioredoxin family protein [Kiritimatiellia bacterium]
MKLFTLMAALTLCFSLTSHGLPVETGATPGQWTMDFDAARKVANEKKLPILINFTGSDWCVWCQHMEKEVFSKKEWQDYAADSLLMVWIDFPQDKKLVPEKFVARNEQLAEFFEIEAYPSYIILDDDGKTQLGELEAEKEITPSLFIVKLKAVLMERASAVEALIETMPAQEGAAFKKACAERAAARKELQQTQNRQNQLAAQLVALEAAITTLRTNALAAELPPAQAAKYKEIQTALTAAKSDLAQWVATNPAQTPENNAAYATMNKKISDLEEQLSKILYAQ